MQTLGCMRQGSRVTRKATQLITASYSIVQQFAGNCAYHSLSIEPGYLDFCFCSDMSRQHFILNFTTKDV